MKKEKLTVVLGNVNIGSLTEPWHDRSDQPNCGNAGKFVLAASSIHRGIGLYEQVTIKNGN